MTREKGKSAALNAASTALYLLFLAGFFFPSLSNSKHSGYFLLDEIGAVWTADAEALFFVLKITQLSTIVPLQRC